jgi:hypothetical protein
MLSVRVVPIVIGSEQLFKDEKKDEHFALLSAGCVSQRKVNRITVAGYQIKKPSKKTPFPIFATQSTYAKASVDKSKI